MIAKFHIMLVATLKDKMEFILFIFTDESQNNINNGKKTFSKRGIMLNHRGSIAKHPH